MAGFIQNILWNSVEGFVEAGTRSAGDIAGNALIKAGDLIEGGGRSVGNGTSSHRLALIIKLLIVVPRHREESNRLRLVDNRPDLPTVAQSSPIHSSQAHRQALELHASVEQAYDWCDEIDWSKGCRCEQIPRCESGWRREEDCHGRRRRREKHSRRRDWWSQQDYRKCDRQWPKSPRRCVIEPEQAKSTLFIIDHAIELAAQALRRQQRLPFK